MLTTQQKISAYTYALEEIKRRYKKGLALCGVCGRLDFWCFRNNLSPSSKEEWFAEFYIYRRWGVLYWWPLDEEGTIERIAVLTKIIEDLAKTQQ